MFGLFFAKAITGFVFPALTAGVLQVLSTYGIGGSMTVNTIITSFLTGLAVYIVPNAKR